MNELTEELYKVSCVSVVNSKQWAEHAISGFLLQEYPNKELILVDISGSIEISPTVNIEILTITEKVTIGEAKNRAIAVSKGQIIANWEMGYNFHPSRLTTQVAAMAQNESPVCFYSDVSYDVNDRQGIFENAYGAMLDTAVFIKHPQMLYGNTNHGYNLNILYMVSQIPDWKAISIPGHTLRHQPLCTKCC